MSKTELSEEEKTLLVRTNKAKILDTLREIFQTLEITGMKHNFHTFYDSRTKEYVAVIRFNGNSTEYKHKDPEHLVVYLFRVIAPTLPTIIKNTKLLRSENRKKLKKNQQKR